MDYPQETHELILRMERANLANPQPFNKREIRAALEEAYKLSELQMPRIVWVTDFTDKHLLDAAWAARAARSVGL